MAKNDEQGAGAQGNTEAPPPGETKPAGGAGAAGTTGEQKPGNEGKGAQGATDSTKPGDGTQTKEEKPGDQGGKGGDGGKGEKTAPEKYELKVPEGSTLDATDIAAIEALARENKWDNATAQAAVEQHHNLLVETSNKFLAETNADKEYGGDKLPATQARAKAVIDLVRPASHPRAKAFRALLDKSGYGNNIEVISFLADLGKMTEEDGVTGSTGASAKAQKSPEETLYNGQ